MNLFSLLYRYRYTLPCSLLLCGICFISVIPDAFAHDCFDRLMRGDNSLSDCMNSIIDQVGPVLASIATIAVVVAAAIAAASIGGPAVLLFGAAMTGYVMYQGYKKDGVSGAIDAINPFTDLVKLLVEYEDLSPMERLGLMAGAAGKTFGVVSGVSTVGRLGQTLQHTIRSGRALSNARKAANVPDELMQGGVWAPYMRGRRFQTPTKPRHADMNQGGVWPTSRQAKLPIRDMSKRSHVFEQRAGFPHPKKVNKKLVGESEASTSQIQRQLNNLNRSIRDTTRSFRDRYNLKRFGMRNHPLNSKGTPAQMHKNGCWNATMRGQLKDMGYPPMTERQLYDLAYKTGGVYPNGASSVRDYERILKAVDPALKGQRLPQTSLSELRTFMNKNPDSTVSLSIRSPGSNMNHRVRLEGTKDGVYYSVGDPANGRSWTVHRDDLSRIMNSDRSFVISR